MYEVKTDTENNILILKLEGFLSSEETSNAADEVIEKAKTLQDEFVIINDIAGFKPVSQKDMAHIQCAQKEVEKMGVKKVIRVVGSSLGKAQFNRTTTEGGITYETAAVKTMEEALREARK